MARAHKICAKPGCPAIAERGASHCLTHKREADKQRGSREQRGYGSKHQAERKRWEPIVASGAATCARCKQPIYIGQAWALDHHDADRTKYLGPSHSTCNNKAGGQRRHQQ